MTALQSKYSSLIVHVMAWAALIGMPLFVIGTDCPLISGEDYLRFLVVPVSFMAVFYLNYFFLIERYLFTRHVWKFLLLNVLLVVVAMYAVHLLFRYVIVPDPLPGHVPPPVTVQGVVSFFVRNALLYFLVVGLCVAIRMTGSWYRAEAERQELRNSNTQAELENLKSQLNPHFLFNTLNNIYSLIQIDGERARQAVHDLSRMLRYMLYDSSRQTVSLGEEVNFLRDYIELMRIRLPRHVELSISLPDSSVQTGVAPLLFISLVENAFKHGVSNDRPSYIDIDIHEDAGRLVCIVENSSYPKSSEGSGIGLANLSKRLDMIYPGHYRLECGNVAEDVYRAELTIDIN